MQLYSYKAKDAKGALVKGRVEANNEAGVADSLLKRQYIPISISLVETKNNSLYFIPILVCRYYIHKFIIRVIHIRYQ